MQNVKCRKVGQKCLGLRTLCEDFEALRNKNPTSNHDTTVSKDVHKRRYKLSQYGSQISSQCSKVFMQVQRFGSEEGGEIERHHHHQHHRQQKTNSSTGVPINNNNNNNNNYSNANIVLLPIRKIICIIYLYIYIYQIYFR